MMQRFPLIFFSGSTTMKSAQGRPRDHSLHPKPVMASRVLVVACVMAGVAWGFDDRREGFTLSGGIGAGAILWKNVAYLYDGNVLVKGLLQENFAVSTDMRLGAGIGQKMGVSLTCKSTWYAPGEALVVNSTVGPAFRFFFDDIPPSAFMTVSSGLAFRLYPVNLSWNKDFAAVGWGVSLGVGYEFRNRRSLELAVESGRVMRRRQTPARLIDPADWTIKDHPDELSYLDEQTGFSVALFYSFWAY